MEENPTNGQRAPSPDPPPRDESRDDPVARPPDLFSELKRRKVYRVGAGYLAVAFAVLQGAELVFPTLGLGPRVFNALVLSSLLGFPLAVALAWMFDITAEGIRRTPSIETEPARGDSAEDGRVRLKAGLVGAGFVAVIWFGVHLWQVPVTDGDPGVVPVDRPVLAVLPFQDLSPGGDQVYFADGLHEELLHQLAVLRSLRLVSRTSLLHFRGRRATLGAIADSLGARYVVEGSVRRAADSVRVTVQLIDARSDEHLWSESYDRALSVGALFDLQRTLAMRLARSLGGTLSTGGSSRVAGAPTASLDAYNAYLRGLHHFNDFSRESLAAAANDFMEALDADSRFGQAHAMLAMTYVVQNNLGLERRGERFPQIREHAEQALQYAPDAPETHFALGSVHYTLEWNWPEARREFEAVRDLDPGRQDWMWSLAEWHGIVAGDTERALRILNDALRLDPFAAIDRNLRASVLHFGRRYAESADEYARLRAIDPGNPVNTMNLVSNLALSGQMEEARRLMAEALPRVRRSYGPTLAVHLMRIGDRSAALEVWREALARRQAGASISAASLAAAAVAVGENDQALDWLERAFADEGGIYTLRDPLWDPLRGAPRFQALWDRVGLPGPEVQASTRTK